MIADLTINGFKRFSSCSLDIAPLTVLAGLNGAGKTSVIQALLLLREASLPGARSVPLNGPLGLFGLELGSAQDVLNITRRQFPSPTSSSRDGFVDGDSKSLPRIRTYGQTASAAGRGKRSSEVEPCTVNGITSSSATSTVRISTLLCPSQEGA